MDGPKLAAACAATAGLFAGGAWYASAWPASQIFGRTLIAGDDPQEFALTYDDGPNPAATPQLLDVLAGHDVRATFFVIGSYARQHPELIRRSHAAGHTIGNHTMLHPRLSIQSAARIREELLGCSAVLEDILGTPVTLFRPPFGARRPYVLRTARELELTPVMWNVTAHDWHPIGSARILANLNQGIARNQRRRRGSNLLLHDGSHHGLNAARLDTVRATADLLSAHRDSPTRFVAIDHWLAAQAFPGKNAARG